MTASRSSHHFRSSYRTMNCATRNISKKYRLKLFSKNELIRAPWNKYTFFLFILLTVVSCNKPSSAGSGGNNSITTSSSTSPQEQEQITSATDTSNTTSQVNPTDDSDLHSNDNKLELPYPMVGRWFSIEAKKWITLTKNAMILGPKNADMYELTDVKAREFDFVQKKDLSCESCEHSEKLIKLVAVDNLLCQLVYEENGEVIENIIRYGIDNASIKGKLVKQGSNKRSILGFDLADQNEFLIQIKNSYDSSDIKEASVTDDGSFYVSDLKSGTYDVSLGTHDEAASPIVSIHQVTIDGSSDDIGIITLSSADYNFKTEFTPSSDFLFDGSSYKAKFRVKNVGSASVKGVNYQLSTSEPSIQFTKNKNGILNTIDPGEAAEVEVEFSVANMDFDEEKRVPIQIILGDVRGEKWNDLAFIEIYKVKVEINVKTLTTVSGIIVFKERKLIPFGSDHDSGPSVISIPYLTNHTYKLILSAATRAQEAVYSIGVKNASAEDNALTNFFDTASFEPNDLESQATKIHLNDSIISYLHVGDLDGYHLSFSKLRVIYNAGDFSGGNAPLDDKQYLPGQSFIVLGLASNQSRRGYIFSGWKTSENSIDGVIWPQEIRAMGWTDANFSAHWYGCNKSESCYSNVSSLIEGTWFTTPSGKSIELKNGIWVEQGPGTRVLASDGFDNWASELSPDGRKYGTGLLNKAHVAGRVCPSNTFVPGNLVAQGKCLYFDDGNAAQTLNAPANDYQTNQTTPGALRLGRWDTTASGNGTGASWYVGNIQTCADKGMRLPTLYETTGNDPGGIYKPSDVTPAWSETGIPDVTNLWTWTASAHYSSSWNYWVWSGSRADFGVFSGLASVRCVHPGEYAPNEVIYDANGGTGSAPIESGRFASGNFTEILTKGDIKKDGFGFSGWNTKSDGSGKNYLPGDNFNFTSDSIILYARWEMPVCGGTGDSCYDDLASIDAGYATTPTGKSLSYINGTWIESASGSRVLASDGSDNWALQLNPDGRSYSSNFLNKANVAGRACPGSVFIPGNLVATGKCLYYDSGNPAQRLDATADDSVTDQSTPGSYRLGGWNTSASGNATGASWYEGNIQTCASKGMRLPALYETGANQPETANQPTVDGAPTAWGGANGVPSSASWTWTASAYTYNSALYWVWSGTWTGNVGYNSSYAVRCVVP